MWLEESEKWEEEEEMEVRSNWGASSTTAL